ncbi:hypothetical protein QJS10_CPA02g00935 [Acorus calamus]|uniref:Myb/SANT-like domain-containing protein n=1 Tax=Acorus calamus TaxID=4465 RepID=A0AAV9FGP0_ACOCL|nr:hypothetical protein QJS10_CPA02g00935 [Acorus calamus]
MESSRGRAAWSSEMKKIFIDLCLEQVKVGGRPGANLKTSAWKKVREEFNQRNLVNYEQKQFKNYWDTLRKQWTTWTRLISLTGIGVVAPGQTVQMDQERWDEHIKAYPDAKQFRYKPLPHADEMEQLFGGVTATGDHRFGSADTVHLVDGHTSTSHNPTLLTETQTPSPGPEEQDEHDPVQTETNYEERMSEVRRKRPCPSRRRRPSEDIIVEKIDGVLDKIAMSASSQAPVPTNLVPIVDECYASLRETPSFVPGAPLYINALRFITIPKNRRLWMLELDPTSRAMLVQAHFSG